jgi:hypothetical protein
MSRQLYHRRMIAGILAPLALVAFTNVSQAAFVKVATSDGYAISVDLNLTLAVPIASATVSPLGDATGTAPAPYGDTAHVASVDLNSGNILGLATLLHIGTGVIDSSASSDANGLLSTATTTGTTTINDLGVGIVNFPLSTFLNVNATTLTSTSQVTGGFGTLNAMGTSSIEDLSISLLGANIVTAEVAAQVANGTLAPNTGLDVNGLVGLSVLLNEQIVTGDGITSRGITTNTIHLHFDAVNLDLGLSGIAQLTGDVIIGHSAAIQAVPEPSSLILCGAGVAILGMGGLRARRRQLAS